MAYIKLGPKGDYFGSARLSLYLSEGNATYVEDSLLYNTLSRFLLTGFFILIEKQEFDNIKIDRKALRGIPLQYVGVNSTTIIEPVIDFLNEPPANIIQGDRFIVGNNPQGEWKDYKGLIVEYMGTTATEAWKVTQPKNKWVIPIYNLGISATYIGTYPSGKWDITEREITQLRTLFGEVIPENISESELATRYWVTQQINQEIENRASGDEYLANLIENIQQHTSTGSVKATEVRLEDAGDFFQVNSVEFALQQLAEDLKDTRQNLNYIQTLLQQLSNQVQQLANSGGGSGSNFNTRAYLYLNVNNISLGHTMGRVPICQLYEFTPTGSTTVNSNTVLQGVIAKPYRLTYNDIRYQFPSSYNLILILA